MSDSNRVSASLAQCVATATKLMFYTHILNDNPNGLLRALWHAFSNDRAGRRDRTRSSLRYGRRRTDVPRTSCHPGPSAPFGATVRRTNLYTIGLYYGFYCRRTDGCRPAFLQYSILFLFDLLPADSADQSGHPHLLAGVSTTMISSMVTPKTAAKMTRLSMEGMAVPWIHL